MAECDRLLRATASVAEEAEKARASIAQATEEAQQHMASLPAVAAKEAEKVREAVRSETEQMLDTSARTLTTLQTRIAAKRPVAPAAQAPEEPAQAEAPSQPESMGDGLRGLARRITAPKRKGDERGRGSFELSDVLAAAEAREPSKAGLKQGAAASLGALQAALADLAGELIELVGETADPALWRRYLEGDRAVFARRLASSIGPESINRVTTLYRDNPRFHEAADNYLSEFEMLLTRARESDRDGFLASTLLTADTGKIYLAIAYALGRLD